MCPRKKRNRCGKEDGWEKKCNFLPQNKMNSNNKQMKKVMIVLRNTVLRLMLTVMVMTASVNVCAQKASQTLRGTVRDAINHEPVAYATIILTDNPLLKAISDSVGRFSIGDVPVGRHNLRCQYVGYETVEMNELLVTSAKETYVDILLSEAVKDLGNLVIRPKVTKEKALNRMVLTGGRMFSVEETSRYAGGFDDPARLATAFAGVASGGATNGISIHGNAPHLLAWHLEDMEIPNPNHFSDISVLGGGIFSSLSAMCIGNSDKACGDYPMPIGTPVSAGKRTVGDTTEYLFTVNSQSREGTVVSAQVYVTVAKDQRPEFTRVVR